jgi:hypothetical protein
MDSYVRVPNCVVNGVVAVARSISHKQQSTADINQRKVMCSYVLYAMKKDMSH